MEKVQPGKLRCLRAQGTWIFFLLLFFGGGGVFFFLESGTWISAAPREIAGLAIQNN